VTRRLVLSYVALAAVVVLALELPLWLLYARHEHDLAGAGVAHDATALASLAEEGIDHPGAVDLNTLAARYRAALAADIMVVDRAGAVVVAPRPENAAMNSAAVRSQLVAVLRGAPGGLRSVHNDDDLVAFEPVGPIDAPVGAIAVSAPDDRADQRAHDALLALVAIAGGVLGSVALLGLVLARSVTRPLRDLEAAARRVGAGDLGARAVPEKGPGEVRALSAAFNTMAARLEELVGAQQTFVADASHQLRSPLTALRLRLENVTAALPPGDVDYGTGDDGDVGAITAELDRLSRVVDGLLALARTDGQRPERVSVDVAAVATERCEAWSFLADEAGVSVMLGPVDKTVASLVPGHLEQILDNLLANALDATPAGRGVTVSVRGREVHVVDEGRGMPAEDRERAFDRFWRGSARRAGTGSGLGLSIVRQLAAANDASVELREAAGGGVDAVVALDSASTTAARPHPTAPRRHGAPTR
jgi:signal transduction histidine kinase